MGEQEEARERVRASLVGHAEWGSWGSAREHIRYARPIVGRRGRRNCGCGCGGRSTHAGCANGLALMSGCELSVRRWVRDFPANNPAPSPAVGGPKEVGDE